MQHFYATSRRWSAFARAVSGAPWIRRHGGRVCRRRLARRRRCCAFGPVRLASGQEAQAGLALV
eukprot:2233026-Lingulodinium_polyedra.AAC.1